MKFSILFLSFCLVKVALPKYQKKSSKLPEFVCKVVEDVVRQEEISTIAILRAKSELSTDIRSKIVNCLPKEVPKFIENLLHLSVDVFLPDSTIYIVFADEMDQVEASHFCF
jgi:biotin synthase-related radical SAM superfamily protein